MKRAVAVLVVVFLGWALVESPDTLAELVADGASTGWDGLTPFFAGVMEFLGNLTS